MDITDKNVIKSGYLGVGNGHELYYEQWGNKHATPTIFLHGGPGGGFKDKHKMIFNSKKHHVLFFDQRGSGRSKPYGSTKNNTTADLVNDIEKMRIFFGYEKINIVGRSWGSCLALVYAISYPNVVKQLLIGDVYLGSEEENNYISRGYVKYTYPEAWQRFINMVPVDHRLDGKKITKYYYDKLHSSKEKEAQKYADEWTLWEASTLSLNYDKTYMELAVPGQADNLTLALLETHYFLNNCFMPEDFIIKNIDTISHIPCYVIQGRFDNCTPPYIAYKLAKKYGDNLTLQWVSGGHSSSEPQIRAAEQAAANILLA